MTHLKKLSCLIIDDEPSAHKVLLNYCSNMNLLDLKQSFFNARDALHFLSANPVELLFLDVNMPEIDGFQLLNNLGYKPAVIFTTAHNVHAVKSYDYQAVDFLMKPIPFTRFEEAVLKVKNLYENNVFTYQHKQFIEIKEKGERINLNTREILYLQSVGNYVKIFTKNKNYILHITTSELEKHLESAHFVRVHKSYIINTLYLKKMANMQVELGDKNIKLPIGKTYIKFLSEKLK